MEKTCETRKTQTRLTTKYALINNIQNDLFRYSRKALGYIGFLLLGYFAGAYYGMSGDIIIEPMVCECIVERGVCDTNQILPKTGSQIK